MNIAIDFDGTYTADPQLWNLFIMQAKSLGHKIYCVTMRYADEKEAAIVQNTIGNYCDEIIYTARIAKKEITNNLNIKIDIWIDDNPAWIYNNSF